MAGNAVLVSWVAVNNDPYARESGGKTLQLVHGKPVLGTTLTLLLDESSPWRGRIDQLVLLHRAPPDGSGERERRAVDELVAALAEKLPRLKVEKIAWPGDDPTDHAALYDFLRRVMAQIRARYEGRELVIHISPGTPSMQTVWVLMVETGLVAPPVQMVKSYRISDRGAGQPAVVPVEVGLETFYRAWQGSSARQMTSEIDDLRWDPQKFRSKLLKETFSIARRYAMVSVPVLITGERGTGKTTLAGWMRAASPFRRKELDTAWPNVACGQYNPETMRSELFGYEKGAFTGALARRDGLLARADGDTLFLDEVGDISRDVQRLLIKALEEGTYLPLGGNKLLKSRFRLLTATNISDAELQKRLDADFLDRISPLRVRMPALRELTEDLQWLWQTTLRDAAVRAKVDLRWAKLPDGATARIVGALRSHPLPGNLRDLFRIAYSLLAARADPVKPLSADDAVEVGLAALHEGDAQSVASPNPTTVAVAWATHAALDGVLDSQGTIDTARAIDDLRSFLAVEIQHVAKRKILNISDISDLNDRTARNWKKGSGK